MQPFPPTPQNPPTESRKPTLGWAWILLGTLFGLLVATQLWEYLNAPGAAEAEASASAEATSLRLTMATDVLILASPGAGDAFLAQTKPNYVTLVEQLKDQVDSNPQAARLALLAGYEAHRRGGDEGPWEPDGTALATLEASDSADDRLFADLYANPPVDATTAAELAQFESNDFEFLLARIQILERAKDEGARARLFPMGEMLVLLMMIGAMTGAAMIGVVVLLLFGIAKAFGKLPAVGYPGPNFEVSDANRLALRMGLYLLLYLAGSIIGALATLALEPVGAPQELAVLVGLLTGMLLTFGMLALPLKGQSDHLGRLLGDRRQFWKHAGIGVLAFAANLPLALGAALLFRLLMPGLPEPSHPVTSFAAEATSPFDIFLLYALVAVVAPLWEEFTFRGLLFPALGRYVGVAGGILISAFLFAAIHPQGPLLWGALMAVGGTAAFITHQTGSLIPAIVMHAVHNAFILTLALLVFGG